MSGRNGTKTTAKATVPTGAMIPQPHGGALRNGGPNRGGPGRPPDALRAEMRGDLTRVLKRLRAKDRAKEIETVEDLLEYAKFLAKYGVGTTLTKTDTKGDDPPPRGRLTDAERDAALADFLARRSRKAGRN